MHGIVAALTAAAIAVGGEAAAAQAPPVAGDYGGGAIASGFSYGKGGRYVIAGVRVEESLGSALLNLRVGNRCGFADTVRRVALAPDGSFTLRVTQRKRVQFKRRQRKTQRLVVFGRVDGNGGSGNARANVTYRTGGSVDAVCRMRKQGFQLRVATAETAAGSPRAGTVYRGLTSQRADRPRPFVLRVDRRAKRVRAAIFQYRRRCATGVYSLSNISPGARIGPGGAFARTEHFAISFSNAVERFRVRMHGQFTPNGVRGTLAITSVARARSDGRVIDRCRSGRIAFAALP